VTLKRVDIIASFPWYAEHMVPVWKALPKEYRGKWYASPDAKAVLRSHGIDSEASATANGSPTLVAASGDMFKAAKLKRPVALMEHGAGQSYGGDRVARHHSSYAGGNDRGSVELFLHPGPHPAERDMARYPRARVEVVGCPKLDTLPARDHSLDVDSRPVVAVSFHWDCQVCMETRSAFLYYRSGIALSSKFRLIGHGHPRIMERLSIWYKRKDIEPVASFRDVLKMADLYACDNSSSLFEFASTGRPVLVLNAPFYRRSVSHGLRFWEAADVGLQVSAPGDFTAGVIKALADPVQAQLDRRAAIDMVYSHRDGTSAQRAADALVRWVSER
jgi:hypothetical protein